MYCIHSKVILIKNKFEFCTHYRKESLCFDIGRISTFKYCIYI